MYPICEALLSSLANTEKPPVCPTGGIKCLTCETILPQQPELQRAGNPNFGEVTPRTKFLFSGSVIQSGSKYNINPLNL